MYPLFLLSLFNFPSPEGTRVPSESEVIIRSAKDSKSSLSVRSNKPEPVLEEILARDDLRFSEESAVLKLVIVHSLLENNCEIGSKARAAYSLEYVVFPPAIRYIDEPAGAFCDPKNVYTSVSDSGICANPDMLLRLIW